ncbi:hypothetical protein EMCRGX_G004756 [Ephydatia muelleri]
MKHLELVSVMCFAFSLLNAAHSRPDGAPQAACSRIFPQHGTYKSQSLDRILFSLNISQLTSGGGYRPGKTYNLTLYGPRVFRGLLIQGRSNGTNPAGSFKILNALTKLSACNPHDSAVTHSSNAQKNNVRMSWTAPPRGTGDVAFHYAVVVDTKTFYATMKTPIIREIADSSIYLTPSTSLPSPSSAHVPLTTSVAPSILTASSQWVPSPSPEPGVGVPPTDAPLGPISTSPDAPTALTDAISSSAAAAHEMVNCWLTGISCVFIGLISTAMTVA